MHAYYYNQPQAGVYGLANTGAMQGSLVSTLTTKNGVASIGQTRNSWTGTNLNGLPIGSGTLLNKRFHRVNLRLSAPTPGEEDLHRHWRQNSTKTSKQNGEYFRAVSAGVIRQVPYMQQNTVSSLQAMRPDRPSTVQSSGVKFATPFTPPATPNGSAYRYANQAKGGEAVNNQNMTSSLSPPSSPQTMSSPKSKNKIRQSKRQEIPPSFNRLHNTPCNKNEKESTDIASRTTSVRPSSAKWRTRTRSPSAQIPTANDMFPNRRWSYSEQKPTNQREESNLDDDSAYSSSRDINLSLERSHVSPQSNRRLTPSNLTNENNRDATPPSTPGCKNERKNGKLSVTFKTPDPMSTRSGAQQLSRRGGATVFYYPNQSLVENDRLFENCRPSTSTAQQRLLPLRNPMPPQQRPQTQPAMHYQRSYQRQSEEFNYPKSVLKKPTTPTSSSKEPKKTNEPKASYFPLSLVDYETLKNHSSTLKANNYAAAQYARSKLGLNPNLNPDTGSRILSWLSTVEQNPDVYYGFETDIVMAH